MAQELPFSHEVERDTLGLMMVEREALERGITTFQDHHFHHKGHLTMWQQMVSMFQQERPINDVSLSDAMRENGTLNIKCSIDMVFATYKEGEDYKGAWRPYFDQYTEKLSAYHQARTAVVAAEKMREAAWRCDAAGIQSCAEEVIRTSVSHEKRRRGQTWKEVGLKWTERDMTQMKGVSTGFRWLDDNLGGLRRGSLVVIAGGASDGKTTLAINIAVNAANDGNPVALFSQEMGNEENWERGLAFEMKVRSSALMKGIFNQQELNRINEYIRRPKPIRIFDDCSTMEEIASEVALCIAKDNVRVVVVDYLQIVDGNKTVNREQEVSEVGKRLKQLAQKHQITVIAMSQLNDDGKVRESRAIKQHCDQMLTILVKEDDDTQRCLKIEKNRGGKRYIKCEYRFEGEHFTFHEIGEMEDKKPEPEEKKKPRINGHKPANQFP